MSIFSSIGGALKGALGGFVGGGLPGAVVGGLAGAAGGIFGGGGGKVPPTSRIGNFPGGFSKLPTINIRKALPGVGAGAAGAAAGYLAGRYQYPNARRRSKGFSARDVRQAKRLMKMLKEVSAAAPKPRVVRSSTRHCD